MSESPIPSDLLESFKEKFATVKQAQTTGNLALLSAIRKSDNKPVAIVCSIQYEDETHEKYVIQPLAVVGDQTFLNEFEFDDEFLERDKLYTEELGLRERRLKRVPGLTAATNDEERINALLDVLADPSTIEDEELDEDEDEDEDDFMVDWVFHSLLNDCDLLPDRTIDVMLGILTVFTDDDYMYRGDMHTLACLILEKMGARAAPALDTLHSLVPLADFGRPWWDWHTGFLASETIWHINGDTRPVLAVLNKLLCTNDGSFSEDDKPTTCAPSEEHRIIQAAGLIGDMGPEAVALAPRLRELQEHKDENVRNAVQRALQELDEDAE
jgi:hypothetical protein